jgi:hypothetical protein
LILSQAFHIPTHQSQPTNHSTPPTSRTPTRVTMQDLLRSPTKGSGTLRGHVNTVVRHVGRDHHISDITLQVQQVVRQCWLSSRKPVGAVAASPPNVDSAYSFPPGGHVGQVCLGFVSKSNTLSSSAGCCRGSPWALWARGSHPYREPMSSGA